MNRSLLRRSIAGAVASALLIATFTLDSITATLGYSVVAAIAAVLTAALHPEANGRLARWAFRQGLGVQIGATPKTNPDYFAAKKSPFVRAATATIALLITALFIFTR